MEKKPIIEFNDFSFKYHAQKNPTLKNINLKIYEGEKILIVGLSGSGKSTIGNCLNGLIPFVYGGDISGSLKIFNEESRYLSVSKISKKIGTVLQDADGQFVGLNVGEDIAFSLENDNVKQEIMKQKVFDIAKIVDMESFLDCSPNELSGGQKQRVALAGVMVDDVDILLFDEPLANLDPATGKTAIELIDDISKNSKKTIIIIEHRLEDVLHRHVDRIVYIKDGEIIMDDTPDRVLASSKLSIGGIREPLYLSACKLAGISIDEKNYPSSIDNFIINDNNKLIAWSKDNMISDNNNNETLLRIKNISFSYDGIKPVLKNISFDVKKGEMISIVGKNGAGKSTLSKILVGFEKEDSGDIFLEGYNIKDYSIFQRGKEIGLVLQNPNQMICNTMVFDEVAYGLINAGFKKEEIIDKVYDTLKICGIYEFRNWPINALSYGQKKRVTIASILVMEPKIIIFDEPTAGQDYYHYSEIMDFLEKLNKDGLTIILITHDMHLMLEYCSKSIVLCDGEKIYDGSSVKVLNDEDVVKKANLKKTSLYDLSQKVNINPEDFTMSYINSERRLRNEN